MSFGSISERICGQTKFLIFSGVKLSISDLLSPSATLEFTAHSGFLKNKVTLFKLTSDKFEIEAVISDGMVFLRRNNIYQNSEKYLGDLPHRVVIQWTPDTLSCGICPGDLAETSPQEHIRSVKNPYTLPPEEITIDLYCYDFLKKQTYSSVEDFFNTVIDCIYLCQVDIRRHACQNLVWDKIDGTYKAKLEPDLTRLVVSCLDPIGIRQGFQVIREPSTGVGSPDFCVMAQVEDIGIAKIAIEAKKADSQDLIKGLTTQLPEYMRSLGTSYGVYLIYWLRSEKYPFPNESSYAALEIEKLHPIQRPSSVRTIGMDLSLQPTASKLA